MTNMQEENQDSQVIQDDLSESSTLQKIWSKSSLSVHKFLRWMFYDLPESAWIKLLAVPLTVAFATNIITGNIQKKANQNAILKDYINQLEKLAIENNLIPEGKNNSPSRAAVIIARGKTMAVLQELTPEKRKQLFSFLQAVDLSKGSNFDGRPILSFYEQDLSGMDLRGIELDYIDMAKAKMKAANLSDAYLYRATLFQTNLETANLRNANLTKAYLHEASLRGADLRGANLSQAYLLATDFRESNLKASQLSGENQPYICNIGIPSSLSYIDKDRDCDQMPELLMGRETEASLEKLQKRVNRAREKAWD